MRTIDEHAKILRRALDGISLAALNPEVPKKHEDLPSVEWERVRKWLALAGGLRHVEVQRFEDDALLCSTAADYAEADNYIVSHYAIENVRLQYVWNGIERLLKFLPLPDLKSYPGDFNRVQHLLSISDSDRWIPTYFSCVTKHLTAHITEDTAYKSDKRLLASTRPTREWRNHSGTLLDVGNRLRNFPAHGQIDVPEPAGWGEEERASGHVIPATLHAPRLATRGLLLSLQLIIATVISRDERLHAFDGPELGWWLREKDGSWKRSENPSVQSRLRSIHLEPPQADDAESDEIEDP